MIIIYITLLLVAVLVYRYSLNTINRLELMDKEDEENYFLKNISNEKDDQK